MIKNHIVARFHFEILFTLIKIGISSKSFPSKGLNGVNNCNLLLAGSTSTSTCAPSVGGSWYVSSPGSNPCSGSSSPYGESSLNFSPFAPVSSSVSGLNLKSPAMESAVTNSGEVTKAWVLLLASLRPVKLRLYDVTIVFFSPFATSCLK